LINHEFAARDFLLKSKERRRQYADIYHGKKCHISIPLWCDSNFNRSREILFRDSVRQVGDKFFPARGDKPAQLPFHEKSIVDCLAFRAKQRGKGERLEGFAPVVRARVVEKIRGSQR